MTEIKVISGDINFTGDNLTYKTHRINTVMSYDAIVDSTGNSDYTTIEGALNDSKTDIFIRNGTYTLANGSLSGTYPYNLKITGQSREGVIVNMGNNTLASLETTEYTTGTITFTYTSSTVTGSGTSWLANVSVNDYILVVTLGIFQISAVNSDTSLTINDEYRGTTVSGVPYVILAMGNIGWDIKNITFVGSTTNLKPASQIGPRLSNLRFTEQTGGYCIHMVKSYGGVISDIVCDYTSADGIYLEDCSNMDIKRCRCQNLDSKTGYLVYSWDCSFVDCHCASSDTGFYCYRGSWASMDNMGASRYISCTTANNLSYGFNVQFDSSIVGCTSTMDDVGIYIDNTENCTSVSGCDVKYAQTNGIYLEPSAASSRFLIGECCIEDCTNDGIRTVNGGDGIVINACSIVDNGGYGINLDNGTSCIDCIISSCIVENNTSGQILATGTGIVNSNNIT